VYRTRFFSTSTIRYLNTVLIIVIRKEPMNWRTCVRVAHTFVDKVRVCTCLSTIR
jgi:hypothetical protein